MEAVQQLKADLDPAMLAELRGTDEGDLIIHHLGLGQFIRNALGLHSDNRALLADTGKANPDDASMVIIETLWRHLRLH